MRHVSYIFEEKIDTYILCSIVFFFLNLCHLWDYVEKYGTTKQATDDSIIWRMRIACWIAKATETHSEYVILITSPRQQWLRERARYYFYTCISWLVFMHRSCITPEWLRKSGKSISLPSLWVWNRNHELRNKNQEWTLVSRVLLVSQFCDILGNKY